MFFIYTQILFAQFTKVGGGGGGGAGVIEACKLNTYSVYAYISCVTSLCLSLNTHTLTHYHIT